MSAYLLAYETKDLWLIRMAMLPHPLVVRLDTGGMFTFCVESIGAGEVGAKLKAN